MQNLIRAFFVFSIAIELYFFDIIPGLIPITILFDVGIIEFCILLGLIFSIDYCKISKDGVRAYVRHVVMRVGNCALLIYNLSFAGYIACTADIKEQAVMNGIRCFTFALLVLENIYLIVGSRHLYLLRKDIEKEL